tara:strand:+ start:42 stop:275 length:234 start_codon:yes stop_codon:yes gene_type:complete
MKTFKQFMSEEDYDRIKDRRLERGGSADGGDDVTPSSGGKKETDAEKKKRRENSKKALDTVIQGILDRDGPGAIMGR